MRVVFMGSAAFACPSLEALLSADSGCDVAGVVTQPDRPKGRSLQLEPCPGKAWALRRSLTVCSPDDVNAEASRQWIRDCRPDLIVVVAYGQLLKPATLGIAPRGCINLHGSLLPRYRGAAPIQWAIARGESVTGVTTMYLNERMDAGDIILQQAVPIADSDTGGTLHDRLAEVGADLLVRTVRLIGLGTAPRTPQDESQATFAPRLKKADGRIDWTRPSVEICNRIRAFNPWPMCYCQIPCAPEKVVLRVLGAVPSEGCGQPGEVIQAASAFVIAAGQGAVRLVEVQPQGRKPMTATAFLHGHPVAPGTVLA